MDVVVKFTMLISHKVGVFLGETNRVKPRNGLNLCCCFEDSHVGEGAKP